MWTIPLTNRIVTSPSPAPISINQLDRYVQKETLIRLTSNLPKILISLFDSDKWLTLNPPNIKSRLNCSSDKINMDPRRNNLN